jgi:putative membrane protein
VTERQPGPNELRDHLANERTFLAWMRTAITIIALGFVVAKFAILLREVGHTRSESPRVGAFVGVSLVMGGLIAAILATVKFLRIRSDIERSIVHFSPALDIALAVVVSAVSVVLATYLILTS